MIARRKKRARIRRIRAIVKSVIYLVLAAAVFCVVWFGIRPLIRKAAGKEEPAAEEEAAEATPTPTPNPDGNTAKRKPLAAPQSGKFGWNSSANGWWYKNEDATQFTDGWQTIDGQKYYFLEDGYLATGWAEIAGVDYYFRKSGVQDPNAKIRRIALTFEDGPSEETDKILDILTENHAKATFFMVGEAAEAFPDAAGKAAEAGMEIASHTYAEDALYDADADTVVSVMNHADEAIEQAAGIKPVLMRPTGTGVSETMQNVLEKPVIFWDVDTMDLDNPNAGSISNTAVQSAQDGSIIRLHDTSEATTGALREMVPALQEAGFKLVTVSELAEAYGYTLQNGIAYYQLRPQEPSVPAETGEGEAVPGESDIEAESDETEAN